MPDTPRPIVILGTGRSFTSVICCMIGQHPDMIGLPETNIFSDPTLQEVFWRLGRGAREIRRSGLLRTIAHFHDGAQTEETINAAEAWIIEHADWTSSEMAAYFRQCAAPRGIVEKSISTCREPATLARVREGWPDALYIHITRQPEDIASSMQSRVDRVYENGKGWRVRRLVKTHSISEYCVHFTSTTLQFMATLPPGQGMNLNGEDFLTDARSYARQICEWAGLDPSETAIESMLHPERSPFAFPGPVNAPSGLSTSFLENPTYSGKPVTAKPMTIDINDPQTADDHRKMALLGNRLGYM